MRLTCPNCGAQYEVPDDVIPSSGRDVQCSNCGDTWFQAAPKDTIQEKDPTPELDTAQETESVENTSDATSDDDAPAEPFEEIEPPELTIGHPQEVDEIQQAEPDDFQTHKSEFEDWDTEDEPEEDDDWSEDQDDRGAEDEPDNDDESKSNAPRGLAPSVAEVLRQEAEHEARVRASEGLQTQTEMGLDSEPADRRVLEAQARMRRLRGLPDGETSSDTSSQAQPDSRRDLLPDIEEINSSLRAGGESVAPQESENPQSGNEKKRRGFRLGFGFIVMLAAFGVFAYSSHQQLAETYPAAAPYLDGFVASANSARVWLDTQVTTLFLKLDQIASGS